MYYFICGGKVIGNNIHEYYNHWSEQILKNNSISLVQGLGGLQYSVEHVVTHEFISVKQIPKFAKLLSKIS